MAEIYEKKEYPIRNLVNWYFGNYCSRKCFDDLDRLVDHRDKLQEFAKKNPKLKMTHREFLELFNNHMKICTLDDSFKRKAIFWKMFTVLQKTPNYKSEDMMIKNGKIETKKGPLDKPESSYCMCKVLGIEK